MVAGFTVSSLHQDQVRYQSTSVDISEYNMLCRGTNTSDTSLVDVADSNERATDVLSRADPLTSLSGLEMEIPGSRAVEEVAVSSDPGMLALPKSVVVAGSISYIDVPAVAASSGSADALYICFPTVACSPVGLLTLALERRRHHPDPRLLS